MGTSEGRPIVRRFVVKRLPFSIPVRSPWILRDRNRPHYLGQYATHALAMAAIDRRLDDERFGYAA